MFDIEGRKFMLVIGIMLILSGATFIYFRSQVSSLERAIGKQNQVLSSFIANVQNELREASPRGPVTDQASGPMEGGIQSEPERCGISNEKIEVSSDDYESDDGTDSDSSNTSSEDDEGIKIGEEEPDIKVIEMLNETQEVIESQGKVIDIAEVSLNDMVMGFIENDSDDIIADLSEDVVDVDDDADEDDDDADDGDDDDDDETDSDIDSIPVDNITVKKLTNIDLEEPIDYNAEKKVVLIQFCKEKGLGDESTLKRYKKQELVNLLSSV
jgi:hypothetical protein